MFQTTDKDATTQRRSITLSKRGDLPRTDLQFVSPATPARAGDTAIVLSAIATQIIENTKRAHEALNCPRYAAITGNIPGRTVMLHSVYAPVHRFERPDFFRSLLLLLSSVIHIVGGDMIWDFNSALDSSDPSTKGDRMNDRANKLVK